MSLYPPGPGDDPVPAERVRESARAFEALDGSIRSRRDPTSDRLRSRTRLSAKLFLHTEHI